MTGWGWPAAMAVGVHLRHRPLFVVGQRSREVLDRILGATFAHWLMSEG